MSRLPDDDHEFDAFLARESALQRRWHGASTEEPPAQLDARVQAEARRAVGARPRLSAAPSPGRWRLPLAAAATVLIGTTLGLMLLERDAHVPEAARERPAPAATAEPGAFQAPAAPGAFPAPAAPAAPRAASDAADRRPAPAPGEELPRTRVQPFSGQALSPPAAKARADSEQIDIEAWLERIRALRRAGRMQEAEQSLRAFRLQHPEQALPEDLDPRR
ncbi:MAG: hypothetical protein IT532_16500 [Burkholderiales bacterium]|nr:hypothetical protein [Burkholderiales bacterium]